MNRSLKLSLALVVGLALTATYVPAAHAASVQDDVVASVNAQREQNGLGSLRRDSTLDAAAQEWADTMSRNKSMTHSTNQWRAERLPAGWTSNGENIAYGYNSASSVMSAWMNSAGHRANILRSGYTRIGIGYAAAGNYWVQIFAGYPNDPAVSAGDQFRSEAAPAVAALRQRLGGDSGVLGRQTGELTCSSTGCKQHFANGIIYSPNGGTFAVTGGHANRYLQLGETSGILGYPRSNEIRTATGSYVAFQNGYLMWSPSTGIRAVTGGHATKYAALGGSEGFLRYPTSDELRTGSGGGSYVDYQGGLSIWSPSTGLRVLSNNHALRYKSLGGSESKVGFPVTEEMPTASGGTWVRYQNGISVWSSRTGGQVVPAGHAVGYGAAGGTESQYGYATSGEVMTPSGGSYVAFERGYSIWGPRTGVRLLDADHGNKYASLGGTQSKLGYPVTGVLQTAGNGTYVQYQNGYTLRSPQTGTFSVPAGHAVAYGSTGGANGPLGFPTSDETGSAANGTTVRYQKGLTVWSPATPVVVVTEGYAGALERAGGVAGPLGYPLGAPTATANGTTMQFQKGMISFNAATGQYTVSLR